MEKKSEVNRNGSEDVVVVGSGLGDASRRR